jgi:hypothetical protein
LRKRAEEAQAAGEAVNDVQDSGDMKEAREIDDEEQEAKEKGGGLLRSNKLVKFIFFRSSLRDLLCSVILGSAATVLLLYCRYVVHCTVSV